MALCLRMVRGGLVDTHKFRLTRYANTIVGCEAVDFLVEEGFASDREEGIRVCQSMLRFWFFAPAFDAGGAGEPPREPAATPPQPLSGSGNPGDGAPGAVFADECVRRGAALCGARVCTHTRARLCCCGGAHPAPPPPHRLAQIRVLSRGSNAEGRQTCGRRGIRRGRGTAGAAAHGDIHSRMRSLVRMSNAAAHSGTHSRMRAPAAAF